MSSIVERLKSTFIASMVRVACVEVEPREAALSRHLKRLNELEVRQDNFLGSVRAGIVTTEILQGLDMVIDHIIGESTGIPRQRKLVVFGHPVKLHDSI